MDCKNALPLVASYLDGELSEAQAGPLRKHLLACQPCRASAQSEKNLKRWFAPTAPVAVPRDFSVRVARLAFSGASARMSEDALASAAPVRTALVPRPARFDVAREAPILPFVLKLTVAAAILALLASVAIRSLKLPAASQLLADDRPAVTLEQALDRLDQIERAEKGTAQPVTAGTPARRP